MVEKQSLKLQLGDQNQLNQLNDDLPPLQLGKQISFNSYVKQLSPLDMPNQSPMQQQFFSHCFKYPHEKISMQEKCWNIDETISKVREYGQQSHNLFEQIIQNKGDEIYSLTNLSTKKKKVHLNPGISSQVELQNPSENLPVQDPSGAQLSQEKAQSFSKKDESQPSIPPVPLQLEQPLNQPISAQDQKMPGENKKVSLDITVPIQNPESQQTITCNCKKSRCLKLYCECFNKNAFCRPGCKCQDCKNKPEFAEKRQKAISYILTKNIQAPAPEPIPLEQQILMKPEELFQKQKIGCNCKKSHCLKKYCECFHNGNKCTELCKCEQCKNGGPNCFQTDDEMKRLLQEQAQQSSEGIAYNLRKKTKHVLNSINNSCDLPNENSPKTQPFRIQQGKSKKEEGYNNTISEEKSER